MVGCCQALEGDLAGGERVPGRDHSGQAVGVEKLGPDLGAEVADHADVEVDEPVS
jgi:hypothetical protein